MSPEILRSLGWGLVSASAHAAVLGCMVLSVRSVLRRHLSPDWRLALGVVVMARLVWPWEFSSAVSLFNVTASLLPPLNAWSVPIQGWSVFLGIWAAGVVLRAGLVIRDGLRVAGWVARSGPVDPLTARLWDEALRAGPRILRRIPVRQSSEVSGPCVAGLLRPCLLLPPEVAAQLSEPEIRLVLLHEAAHLRRWDPILNGLLEVVHAMHWFNPVVGRVLRRWREDREEACDLHALSSPLVDRVQYGRVLLKCLERAPSGLPAAAALGWRGDEAKAPESLVHRVEAIARFRPGRRTWLAGGCTLLAVVLLGLTDPEPLPPRRVWLLRPGATLDLPPGWLGNRIA
ncbi:MAG: M56 family metallopeptidase [Verrucomicrobiota bacterium]